MKLLLLLTLVTIESFGQAKIDSAKIIRKTFTDYDNLRQQRKDHQIVSMYGG